MRHTKQIVKSMVRDMVRPVSEMFVPPIAQPVPQSKSQAPTVAPTARGMNVSNTSPAGGQNTVKRKYPMPAPHKPIQMPPLQQPMSAPSLQKTPQAGKPVPPQAGPSVDNRMASMHARKDNDVAQGARQLAVKKAIPTPRFERSQDEHGNPSFKLPPPVTRNTSPFPD